MRRFWRAVLGILLLALMVEVIIVAPHHAGTKDDLPVEKAAVSQIDTGAEQIMNGVHSLEAQGALKEWELWADQAVRPKLEKVWRIQKVKIQFFKNNHVAFTVNGQKGQVNEGTKDLQVQGNVVTRSTNGYIFETQTVNYNSGSKTLSSPSAVKMFGPKDRKGTQFLLTGERMNADLKTNMMEVLSNVEAHKTIQEGRHLVIDSDRAQFSGVANYAKFFDHVVMDVDTVRITGPEAEFHYIPGTDTIDSVVVTGGAHLSDSDKWATANTVTYDLQDNRFTFEGSPRLVQNNDELVGDKIVFLDGGKQVEVVNAKAKVDKSKVGNKIE